MDGPFQLFVYGWIPGMGTFYLLMDTYNASIRIGNLTTPYFCMTLLLSADKLIPMYFYPEDD